jgi:hypothetical protein
MEDDAHTIQIQQSISDLLVLDRKKSKPDLPK